MTLPTRGDNAHWKFRRMEDNDNPYDFDWPAAIKLLSRGEGFGANHCWLRVPCKPKMGFFFDPSRVRIAEEMFCQDGLEVMEITGKMVGEYALGLELKLIETEASLRRANEDLCDAKRKVDVLNARLTVALDDLELYRRSDRSVPI